MDSETKTLSHICTKIPFAPTLILLWRLYLKVAPDAALVVRLTDKETASHMLQRMAELCLPRSGLVILDSFEIEVSRLFDDCTYETWILTGSFERQCTGVATSNIQFWKVQYEQGLHDAESSYVGVTGTGTQRYIYTLRASPAT